MTSFTKALYRRDPAAANEFHRQQSFEHRAQFGRTPSLPLASFGKRIVPPPTKSDCPHMQTFCIDNGLMAWNCTACKNR